MSMTLEMYFGAESVQQTVSWSDSELEVQRYGRKKNTLTVDPIMLQDELWTRQREKTSPNRRSRFLKNELRKLSFRFLNFEVGSVWLLENQIPTFSSVSAHPYLVQPQWWSNEASLGSRHRQLTIRSNYQHELGPTDLTQVPTCLYDLNRS